MQNNFTKSRNKALELIKNGFIKVDNNIILKPSFFVSSKSSVEILKKEIFVSRAGEKLDFYVKENNINFNELDVLDIGSSKGGFTQVLLKYGAKSVTCVDVGVNQLDETLRKDSRVKVYESCDIRNFKSEYIFDFAVCDVSFISLNNILDSIYKLTKGESILLFKPQFEVGKEARRNKKGVVMQEEIINKTLDSFIKYIKSSGFSVKNISKSSLKGKEGNEEIFINIKKQ